MMVLSIAANMIFGGNIEMNIAIIGIIIFVSGLVVDMIPDFLEKDGKKVIIDIVFLFKVDSDWYSGSAEGYEVLDIICYNVTQRRC